ncbi:hypothetical protein RBU60_07385 [Mesonia sp. MT50]|uniref:Uncharacterized protein n=1 Tax=Mesonia profundi TaxID=3070998 RepID=A0ABU1A104_9FLAO|nr:hypothetical protein [Mesonia profundi]MDQ7917392.1 hypothetical protein [Mesonia profundi]
MDEIFWICVELMKKGAAILGITYEEFNVILFVLIHPAITLFFIFSYWKYKKLYSRQRKSLSNADE